MYADSGDYTYPDQTEKLLAQSVNWPGDVNQALLAQQAENIRLQECNAWLESALADMRQEVDRLSSKVAAQGRQLGRIAKMVEGRE